MTEAHAAGRLVPLTPGLYPEMSVVVTVFEVPLTPRLLNAIAAQSRPAPRGVRS